MTARALKALNGPHGNFLPGQIIHGVPADVVAVWIHDGAAAEEGTPAAAAATPSAPGTAGAVREAVANGEGAAVGAVDGDGGGQSPDPQTHGTGTSETEPAAPTGRQAFAALKARAVALGINAKGMKRPDLEAAVAAAEA